MDEKIIEMGYYWYGYSTDITELINKCGICHNEKAEKQREYFHEKNIARGLQRSHGEVYTNIALTLTGSVIYREINREQPAVSLVRNDRPGKRSAG